MVDRQVIKLRVDKLFDLPSALTTIEVVNSLRHEYFPDAIPHSDKIIAMWSEKYMNSLDSYLKKCQRVGINEFWESIKDLIVEAVFYNVNNE